MPVSIFHPDYPKNPRNLGQFLKKIRMEIGLQIKQAAKLSGLKPMTIVSWEQSYRKPKRKHLERLLSLYESEGVELGGLVRFIRTCQLSSVLPRDCASSWRNIFHYAK
jgi:transcriptional regulator with XRE-family HTH domain